MRKSEQKQGGILSKSWKRRAREEQTKIREAETKEKMGRIEKNERENSEEKSNKKIYVLNTSVKPFGYRWRLSLQEFFFYQRTFSRRC